MSRYPRTHVRTALLLAAILALVITSLPAEQETRVPVSLAVAPLPPKLETSIEPPTAAAETPSTPVFETLTVRPGDSLARIFSRQGLAAADLQAIIDLGGDEAANLKRIFPGSELLLHVDDEGVLQEMRYSRTPLSTVVVRRSAEGFTARTETAQTQRMTAFRVVAIDKENSSLYLAGKRAGLSDNILMELSHIFQWDISFALDIRTGDTFALLYEEVYANGDKVKDGKILAANFVNMGKSFTAVRYADQNGKAEYFSPDGMSMRKAFIRDPVHFSYVSSGFNLRRLHPIHKRAMPHRGIDYAARRGTPVVAAGDGKVTIARQNNASGKYIVVQHGEQYTTKYLHLSRFAKGIRSGKNVRQGETIGYVGATGWATGPHLHYEFLVNGVHRNPRTVKLPKADPIPASNLTDFKRATGNVLLQLAAIQGRTGFASLSDNGPGAED